MKKIKIFLGAYVNFPNAQNVNCDNVARYLDKDKFEVHAMYTTKMPIDKAIYAKNNVHLHKLIHHRFIWWWCKYFTMLFGRYDIYYLPKYETVDLFFAKHHRKRVFVSSIEGVVGEQIPANDEKTLEFLSYMNNYFGISRCITESVKKHWNKSINTLYLGIDIPYITYKQKKKVERIIWVGSVIERKRPEYLLECAKKFPQLKFAMIGDGDMSEMICKRIVNEKISNVEYLGRIQNKDVYKYMENSDLLLMTSDKEGLPKVIGEGMAFGIPAIYFDNCYNVDYIDSGFNGFAVKTLEEMFEVVRMLLNNGKITDISFAAQKTIEKYIWSNLITEYNEYFSKIFKLNKR